jgi:hypothetical protein
MNITLLPDLFPWIHHSRFEAFQMAGAEETKGNSMSRLIPIAVFAAAALFAYVVSPPVSEALPLHFDGTAQRADDNGTLVRRRRWHWSPRQGQTSIAVFIIPGLYWGPAWWDPNYARLCWQKTRPCRGCAENWVYTC